MRALMFGMLLLWLFPAAAQAKWLTASWKAGGAGCVASRPAPALAWRGAPRGCASPSPASLFRPRFERQRVQLTAHFAFERGIDGLVLGDAAFTCESARRDNRLIMIPIPCEIDNLNFRVRESLPQVAFNLGGGHRHEDAPWG